LGIKQQLERNSAVVVFKHIFVVVPERFCMFHSNEEWIVNASKNVRSVKLTDGQHQGKDKPKSLRGC
jgi:hypothetical protein